ncbi:MAG: hypothetical protein F2663_05165 [Actinobacteria bacterium]|uniref:Unannotated protein n=1 Tax=freshwater metagenome TaxID=449393 RepID=A0A6J6PC67_9ZZZZ|nr:hypothetical protein [Actinomycetota bacterium]
MARLQSPVAIAGLALLVAAAGASVAMLIAGTPRSNTGETTVAAPPPVTTPTTVEPVTTAPATTAPVTTVAATTTAGTSLPVTTVATTTAPAPTRPQESVSDWPSGKHGWTVVLGSYPTASGKAAAGQVAARAKAAGLNETGVLTSDGFSSLRAGYLVAYAGVYSSADAAANAVAAARVAGFASAYAREIAP